MRSILRGTGHSTVTRITHNFVHRNWDTVSRRILESGGYMKSTGLALRVIAVIFLVSLVGLGSFGAGIAMERYVVNPASSGGSGIERTISSIDRDTSDTPEVTLEMIEEVIELLEEDYYYGDLDRRELLYDALEGMVGGLPDQYTVFMRPTETRMSREQLSGEYEGIGVWVDQPDGRLTIISPMRGSPAEEAGLQPGDVVLEVDGVSIEDMPMDDAVRRVRGPEGTSVNLTIEREGEDDLLEITVERARIELPAVMYELEDDIAIMTVTIMGDNTIEELDQAIEDAQDAGAEGIILDLRSNGGGWVSVAQEMIGRFVEEDEGAALYERRDPDSDSPTPLPIQSGETIELDIPLVVLVNGSTASAAEIVAGALQEYERATVIGTVTLGKGSIQRIHQLDDGSSVRVTIAEWLTPLENVIQDDGIQPDIEVEMPDADALDDAADDPQLERAIEFLEEGE
jgi:carboxyl-terminal processing protease